MDLVYTSVNKIVKCNLLADKKYYESRKAFAAAGDILAQVWSQSVIDSYTVVAEYLSPTENISEAMIFMEGEKWKAKHVMQSQYMSQIVRCNNITCCDKWRTNYSAFFPWRYMFSAVIDRKSWSCNT